LAIGDGRPLRKFLNARPRQNQNGPPGFGCLSTRRIVIHPAAAPETRGLQLYGLPRPAVVCRRRSPAGKIQTKGIAFVGVD